MRLLIRCGIFEQLLIAYPVRTTPLFFTIFSAVGSGEPKHLSHYILANAGCRIKADLGHILFSIIKQKKNTIVLASRGISTNSKKAPIIEPCSSSTRPSWPSPSSPSLSSAPRLGPVRPPRFQTLMIRARTHATDSAGRPKGIHAFKNAWPSACCERPRANAYG